MTQRGSEPDHPDEASQTSDPVVHDTESVQVESSQVEPDRVEPDRLSGPAGLEQVSGHAAPDQVSDQSDPDQSDPDQSDPDQSDPDQSDPDQSDPDQSTPERVDQGDPAGLRSVTEIRKPSTLGGIIYLAVLAGALVGVVVAATGAWRSGVSWIALAVLAAAGARLALSDDDAGMLQVRRKAFDATILVAMGVTLLVLVASIPEQPS
ncbi:hypothetical protein ASG90_03065 [Nocardioides sp. Soil797]|nr:hypothetical protein ASG90_03065 [Nocardioides sp. Soil797]